MLCNAGMLTLEICEKLLVERKGLKDASPYNILFNGPFPVFVDLTSIEARKEKDPIWLAYNQFVKMFVFPLMLHKHLNISLSDIFLSRLDGIELEETKNYLGISKIFNPLVFLNIFLPYLFSQKSRKKAFLYKDHQVKKAELANFILERLFKRNKKILTKLMPSSTSSSKWVNYMEDKSHYSSQTFSSKEEFVSSALKQLKPKVVLDIGSNTGHFSFMATNEGAKVVSIDYDQLSIDKLWARAYKTGADILPLVLNISRPSPAVGWNNNECLSFIDRAKGKFDMVFMLAVIHHMLVSDRIPLKEIAKLASNLTTKFLILEFIEPKDPMFNILVRGRESLYSYITIEIFKQSFEHFFNIKKETRLDCSYRSMFLMEKKH